MKKVLTVTMDGISVQTLHGIDISMSYGLNYLCLCYFSFQRETSLFLECGWQTHTLFYREVSLCLGLKPFLFHQLSWWFFFTQVLNKKQIRTVDHFHSPDLFTCAILTVYNSSFA